MSIMIPAWIDGRLEPVEKLDAHRRGLKHRAVSVFVMAGDDVLLQRRAPGKYHTPGLWANTCCTHPAWNEDAARCAIRRLDEELGIKGLAPIHCDQVEYRADVGNGLIEHEVVELFIAPTTKALKIEPNPTEVAETRWMNLYDMIADVRRKPDLYTPWLQIYLRDHYDSIFGNLMRA